MLIHIDELNTDIILADQAYAKIVAARITGDLRIRVELLTRYHDGMRLLRVSFYTIAQKKRYIADPCIRVRVPRSMPLADVRAAINAKFSVSDGYRPATNTRTILGMHVDLE